ncbi:MAG: DUF72 domain-containing protein [Polyangiaceae bacterium]
MAGTSGFSYKEWRGTFYEERLPEAKMLEAYATKLPTVEINNTFYRMPKAALFEGWRDKTPAGFTFALKAPRRITHISKLKNAAEQVPYLVEVARVLGDKLGPTLFQLPPTFRKDTALLSELCSVWPRDLRAALEFRHSSWFSDDVYAVLEAAGVALCAAEVDPDEGEDSPYVRTAPFTYVRLRRAEYSNDGLGAALDKIRALKVDSAFVYLKHEVKGPAYAQQLLRLAAT